MISLLLSGCGVKGVVYIGVFKFLHEKNIQIEKLFSISAGNLFALAYLLGYSWQEMEEEVMLKDFSEFKNIKIMSIFGKYGIDDGNSIIKWLEYLMKKKDVCPNITFRELYEKTKVHYSVITTNLNKQRQEFFDHDTYPEVKVLDAIRYSISIPFFFTAEKYKDEIHVDGGVIDNYPVHSIKEDNLIGVKVTSKTHNGGKSINSFEDYISSVFKCYSKIRDKSNKNTIIIPFDHFILDFDLDDDTKKQMIDTGYINTSKFFSNA